MPPQMLRSGQSGRSHTHRRESQERLLTGLLPAVRELPIPEPDDPFWDRMSEQIMAKVRDMRPPWLSERSPP
jgi:hypothetical protein